MSLLDTWHAASTTGEAPPFQLGSYDPTNKAGTTPETFATFLAADTANSDAKLTEEEKLRFTIGPETIAAADSMAAVAIQKTIEDVDFSELWCAVTIVAAATYFAVSTTSARRNCLTVQELSYTKLPTLSSGPAPPQSLSPHTTVWLASTCASADRSLTICAAATPC